MRLPLAALLVLTAAPLAPAADGNRLTYLDENNPYYVSRTFPRLTTPQWVGEPGVEAVVILAIDDMREHPKYEAFLRPILRRLQKIDGRAGLIPHAKVKIYPDSAHGFLFQHHTEFAADVDTFLNE